MTSPKKITFVLPSLIAGGAERVMSFVSKNLDKTRFSVNLLIAGYEKDTAYNVDEIETTYLNKKRVLHAFPSFIKYLRIQRPDIVVSSITHLNILMALVSVFFPKIKFIGREASVLGVHNTVATKKRKLHPSFLNKYCYNMLDSIICQSNDMAEDLIANYNVRIKKINIINNPISSNLPVKSDKDALSKTLQLITIGRFDKVKGHKRILEILAKLRIPFHYTLIGDGPEKESVFTLINKLGLEEKITYVRFTKEVSKYLLKSDLFLQGSYVEGFPNAVLESCAVGVPCVVFNIKGGTREIVEHGINGYVSYNEEEFLSFIEKYYKSERLNPITVSRSVNQKFNKEKIINSYESLLDTI